METELIALISTSAGIAMCVVPMQSVLTLLGHSLALVILVISVTVSDASMLMNVQLELIIAMKTQLVVTHMAHLNAHAMMDFNGLSMDSMD